MLQAQPIVALDGGEIVLRELTAAAAPAADDRPARAAQPEGWTRWLLHQAARQAAEGGPVVVTLPSNGVAEGRLAASLSAELRTADISPARVVLGIPEPLLLGSWSRAMPLVKELSAQGFPLALTDFGTGYGSFEYLVQIPADYLWMDSGFVRDLATGPATHAAVEWMVNLGHQLGVRTIAGDIDDLERLERLRALGVDLGQGEQLGRATAVATT